MREKQCAGILGVGQMNKLTNTWFEDKWEQLRVSGAGAENYIREN